MAGDAHAETALGIAYENGLTVPVDDEGARYWYTKAERQGDPDAEYLLGRLYETGGGVAQNLKTAEQWYMEAAKRRQPDAERRLALLHSNLYPKNSAIKFDPHAALFWARRAALDGDAFGATRLGTAYMLGKDIPFNKPLSAQWLIKGVQRGDFIAAKDLGTLYRTSSPADLLQAFHWDRVAFDSGIFLSTEPLAFDYELGLGIHADPQAALEVLKLASQIDPNPEYQALQNTFSDIEQNVKGHGDLKQWVSSHAPSGDARALTMIGWMQTKGFGTKQDSVLGSASLVKAAEMGYGPAVILAAESLLSHDSKADVDQALSLLESVARQGDDNAASALGFTYMGQQLVKPDIHSALFWLNRAADKGNPAAQLQLAWLYSHSGLGADVDLPKAEHYLEVLAENGVLTAQFQLANLYLWNKPSTYSIDMWVSQVASRNNLPIKPGNKSVIDWYRSAASNSRYLGAGPPAKTLLCTDVPEDHELAMRQYRRAHQIDLYDSDTVLLMDPGYKDPY